MYKASTEMNVPWSTFKKHVSLLRKNFDIVEEMAVLDISKLSRPFVLGTTLELKLLFNIIHLQEVRFGLTVLQAKQLLYELSVAASVKLVWRKKVQVLIGGHWFLRKDKLVPGN